MKEQTHSSSLKALLGSLWLCAPSPGAISLLTTFGLLLIHPAKADEITYDLAGANLSTTIDPAPDNIRLEISTNPNFTEIVTTHSGTAGSDGAIDGNRLTALFDTPTGIARDSEGNLFIADTVNHRIRLLDSEGQVTTIAGSEFGFADGEGTAARFQFPTAVAVAPNGDLYVADTFNHAIRKVARPNSSGAWTVTTLAGTGQAGFSNGAGLIARFNLPQGLTCDQNGNVYVADSGNHLIREIKTDSTVRTFAGTEGQRGYQDGVTTEALFDYPLGVAFDESGNPDQNQGNLYVADRDNNRIRKIDLSSVDTDDSVETIGTNEFDNPVALVVYGDNIYVSTKGGQTIQKITLGQDGSLSSNTRLAGSTIGATGNADGAARTVATFNCPSGICADSDGNLYIADADNHILRRIITSGLTVPADQSGTTFTAQVSQASLGLSSHSISNPQPYYFRWIDESNNIVQPLTPPGSFQLFAPPVVQTGPANGAINPDAPVTFTNSAGVASFTNATLYAEVDTRESATTVTFEYSTDPDLLGPLQVATISADNALLQNPRGIAEDSNGNIYVSDSATHRIYKFDPPDDNATGWTGSVWAGSGAAGFSDGSGTNAQFDHPAGLAYDSSDGSLYLADELNHCIRRISASGDVTTVAGSGIAGFDNAEDAPNGRFLFPTGLAFSGNTLYVADRGNHRIRAIEAPVSNNSQRNIEGLTTLAGNGISGLTDGAADSAQFNNPTALAVSSTGVVLVADRDNHCIRAINTATSFVSTRAGTGIAGFQNGAGTVAQFNSPAALRIDADGNCYVADRGNHCIRLVDAGGITTTHAGSGTAGHVDSPPDLLFPATAAAFEEPQALVLTDGSVPTLYVAESGGGLLRQVSRATLPTAQTSLAQGSPSVFTVDHTIAQELLPSATYYFRARALNERTETVTEITSFTMPSLQSLSVFADFEPTTALLNDQSTVIDYGTTPLGVVVSRGFSIVNNGEWPLAISALTVPGGYELSTAIDLPATISEGQSLNFDVSLTGSPGAIYSGNLQVISDDPDTNVFSIPLSGTVLDPPSVATLPAEDPTETTALLSAQINPNGTPTEAWFAYSLDPQLDGVDVTTLTLTSAETLPNNPSGLAADSFGNIYVADSDLHQVLRISPNPDSDGWVVSTIAGDGTAGFADGAPGTAQFNHPTDLAIGEGGSIYVADRGNNRIRVIDPDGTVRTLVGTGEASFTDGDPSAVRFNSPTGIAIDAAGLLYVADSGNHRIRTVSADGATTTLAGGSTGDNTTDGSVLDATLIAPYSVAIGPDNTIYFTESDRNHIRQISGGSVSTLAGSELTTGYQDGHGSTARFHFPRRVAINTSGNILVADTGNHRIRMVSSSGTVTTLAGSGTAATTDGVGDTIGLAPFVLQADLLGPHSITVDPDGMILVGQSSNGAIRRIASNTIVVEATTTDGTTELTGNQTIEVTALAGELIPQAQYYTRAYARNSGGTANGVLQEFMGRALTRFQKWQVKKFGSDAETEEIAGPNADPDDDGFVNLMEYALLSEPLDNTSVAQIDCTVRTGRVSLQYTREIDSVYVDDQDEPGQGDLVFNIESSTDLQTWVPASDLTVQTAPLANGTEEEVYASIPLSVDAAPDTGDMAPAHIIPQPKDPENYSITFGSRTDLSAGRIELSWPMLAGKTYELQRTKDLQTWNTIHVITPYIDREEVYLDQSDGDDPEVPRCFYRVKQNERSPQCLRLRIILITLP